jgi:preprotein translocase subunit YajC
MQMIPLVAIVVIMYFLILRPQQQKMKAHAEMVAGLKRNDVVVTSGGIIGKVIRVLSDAEVTVEIAEGVRVRVIRATITEVRTRSDVREVEARKAASRKEDTSDDDSDGDSDTPLVAANDSGAPKKD